MRQHSFGGNCADWDRRNLQKYSCFVGRIWHSRPWRLQSDSHCRDMRIWRFCRCRWAPKAAALRIESVSFQVSLICHFVPCMNSALFRNYTKNWSTLKSILKTWHRNIRFQCFHIAMRLLNYDKKLIVKLFHRILPTLTTYNRLLALNRLFVRSSEVLIFALIKFKRQQLLT